MIIIMKLHSRRYSFGSQINIIIFPRGTHACARDRQRPNLRTTLRNIATKTALVVTTVTLVLTYYAHRWYHRYCIPRLLLLLLLLRLGTPTPRGDGREGQKTFFFVSSSAHKQDVYGHWKNRVDCSSSHSSENVENTITITLFLHPGASREGVESDAWRPFWRTFLT